MEIAKYILRVFLAQLMWAVMVVTIFTIVRYLLDPSLAALLQSESDPSSYAPDLILQGVLIYIASVLAVAIVLTPLVILIQLIYIKKKGGGFKTKYLSRIQTERLKSKLDHAVLFEVCKDAIRSIPAEITATNKKEDKVYAKTGTNNSGLGEKISVIVGKNGIVEISSKSINPLKVLDLGRNVENVRIISRYVLRESE